MKLAIILILLTALTTTTTSQVSNRCAWLAALRKMNLDDAMVANLMCIAHHSSDFNKDYRIDDRLHGVFQIGSDEWCLCSKYPGPNRCNMPCSALRDQNPNDDIQCALHIIQSQGYKAWGPWNKYCTNRNLNEYLTSCSGSATC